MKTIKTTGGEVVFCDVCEAAATLAVELRDGSRMCAECVMVAAALVRDAGGKQAKEGE